MSLYIRFAQRSDASLVLEFIRELAVFEGMGHLVTATESHIEHSLFQKYQAQVLIAEYEGIPAAFALFYPVYSTFSGGQNLFLEDLYVREAYRGKGIGKTLMKKLAQIALEQGAQRLDWYVLEENKKGAEFYQRLGAKPLLDRRTYRMGLDDMKSLVNGGGTHV